MNKIFNYMMFLNILIGLCVYNLIEHQVSLKCNKKNKVFNHLSGIHIFLVFIINTLNLCYPENDLFLNMVKVNSGGYFVNHGLAIIKHKKKNLFYSTILIHHLLCIGNILYMPRNSYGSMVLIMAEFSNLPGYFIYDYLQSDTKNSKTVCKIYACKQVQIIIYSIIRLIVLPYLTYLEYFIQKNYVYSSFYKFSYLMHVMGFVYSGILFKNLYSIKNKYD